MARILIIGDDEQLRALYRDWNPCDQSSVPKDI